MASYYPINDKLASKVEKGILNDNCYRFYPHKLKGEGQFLSVIKKNEDEINYYKELKRNDKSLPFSEFAKESLKPYNFNLFVKNNYIYSLPKNIDLGKLNVISYGVKLGEVVNNRFVPDHYFFKAYLMYIADKR